MRKKMATIMAVLVAATLMVQGCKSTPETPTKDVDHWDNDGQEMIR